MRLHHAARTAMPSERGSLALRLLEAGGRVALALAAGFVGLYTVLYLLGRMGLL